MNSDILAEWMLRRGYSVIHTSSSYWMNAGPRVYQAFPYHWEINPSDMEIERLLVDYRAIAIRFSMPQHANVGSPSYHVVCDQSHYGYGILAKKARHDIEKGLSVAIIEPISFQRLATHGWGLRRETLIRQSRQQAESEEWWRKLCLSADGLQGFEAWGALIDNKLVASLLGFTCDEFFSILYQQSLTEYLPYSVNNALAYVVTSEVLRRPSHPKLFYGLHSLDAPSSVDNFKFRMGYRAKPVRQRVEFHPLLRPFVNPISHSVLNAGRRVFPMNATLSKTEGIVRLFLENQLAISSQKIPDSLLNSF